MKQKYFERAKLESFKSDHPEYKIGAVVVRKNKILSFGHNVLRTHPKSLHKYKYIHAEFMAIINIDQKHFSHGEIYIFRQNSQGVPALSRPCSSCAELIRLSGIKKIYYTGYGEYLQETIK